MSSQIENVLPYGSTKRGKILPLEAELALVMGFVNDHIKKGGWFRKKKEDLEQVSKFYWRVLVDNYNSRLVLVDSLGLYGLNPSIQDLSVTEVNAQLRSLRNASTFETFEESLEDANRVLILAPTKYPVFSEGFTQTTLKLASKLIEEQRIDEPLILPTYETRVSQGFIQSQEEIPELQNALTEIDNISREWVRGISKEIDQIERDYAQRLDNKEVEVEKRINQYEKERNQTIEKSIAEANREVKEELAKFQTSTLGLTAAVSPLQEYAGKIIDRIPSIDSSKFQKEFDAFANESKNQVKSISSKVKAVDNDRKAMIDRINNLSAEANRKIEEATQKYETRKEQALAELDELHAERDRLISERITAKDTIDQYATSICDKISAAIANREKLGEKSTARSSASVPQEFIVPMYLVRFMEKGKSRYFIIPPMIKTKKKGDYDFPSAEMNSAIVDAKGVVDKIAEELVFNKRFKTTFDALEKNNFIATAEFGGAVKEGLKVLRSEKSLSRKGEKRIIDLLDDLEL
jgi:hypothetical protein